MKEVWFSNIWNIHLSRVICVDIGASSVAIYLSIKVLI